MSAADPGQIVFRPSPEVVARDIAGQHILVPVRTGIAHMDYLYTTDEIGSFIYSQLDGHRDARELACRVAAAYRVDPARALADLLAFLSALRDAGLVLEGSRA